MTLHVTRVLDNQAMSVAMRIRARVFLDEQGYDASVEQDPADALPTTFHVVGQDTETGEYVAVARALLDREHKKAKIGRVAVLSECRGKKFGAELMNGLEALLPDWVETFALSSQFDKRGFYEKLGYARINDEVYLDAGTPHCMMTKQRSQA